MTHVQSISTGFIMPDRPVPKDRPNRDRFVSVAEYLRDRCLVARLPLCSLVEQIRLHNVASMNP
jgi:hypothetical protein